MRGPYRDSVSPTRRKTIVKRLAHALVALGYGSDVSAMRIEELLSEHYADAPDWKWTGLAQDVRRAIRLKGLSS